jgi:hypothetical protein
MIIRLFLVLILSLGAVIGYKTLSSSSESTVARSETSTNILSAITGKNTIAMNHETIDDAKDAVDNMTNTAKDVSQIADENNNMMQNENEDDSDDDSDDDADDEDDSDDGENVDTTTDGDKAVDFD